MSSVNKVILIGNLGAKPEIRFSQAGNAVCNLSLATSERIKRGDNWEEQTEWHRIVSFGKVAENCGKYLDKGSKVYVEGRLQTRKWEDRDGVTRYTTETVANSVVFLDSRRSGQGASEQDSSQGNGGYGGGGGQPSGQGAGGYGGGGDGAGGYGARGPNDDVPF